MKPPYKKILILALGLILVLALICLGVYLKRFSDYKRSVKDITLAETDITKMDDGVYTGEYDVDFIYARVEVTIQAGGMADIRLVEHKNERGKAAEVVVDRIVEEQTILVDAVAGATNSSTVIKKAVENALAQAVAGAKEGGS